MLRIWSRLPALLRALILAFTILAIGQLPPGLSLAVGLRYTPAIPWWLIVTGVWLWAFWSYLNGRWVPASTSSWRHETLRGRKVPARVWVWSLAAGGAGMLCVLTGALLTGLIADLPSEAYVAPFDLGRYAWWTVLAFFVNVAVTAAVVEESAFRGYMLSIVERRHGWAAAVFSVAVAFYLVHLGHAYATAAFAPFFVAYSVLHGLLVFLTRSIRPSIVLHSLGDLAILPIQYGVIASPLGSSVRGHVVVMGLFAGLSALGLRQLARIGKAHAATEQPDLA